MFVVHAQTFVSGLGSCACINLCVANNKHKSEVKKRVFNVFMNILCNILLSQLTSVEDFTSAFGYILISDAVGQLLGATLAGILQNV